jgi:(p)ppGpp synthase/HD superfamily hydrolase
VSSSAPHAPALGERFDAALAFAVETHRHDARKVSNVPYVAHLLGVCSLVLENGGDEVEACAALLHDAAEDHGGRPMLAEIERRFGSAVAAIVENCSDSFEEAGATKAPWLDRKQAYIAHLASLARKADGEPTLLVSAADKLYNLRSIRDDALRLDAGGEPAGDRVYARFRAGKWGSLWYYRALADVYASVDGRHRLLGIELGALVDGLSGRKDAAELLARYRA